jgi:hypothetical protein
VSFWVRVKTRWTFKPRTLQQEKVEISQSLREEVKEKDAPAPGGVGVFVVAVKVNRSISKSSRKGKEEKGKRGKRARNVRSSPVVTAVVDEDMKTLLPLLQFLRQRLTAFESLQVGRKRDALPLVSLRVELVRRLLERFLVPRCDVNSGSTAAHEAVGDLVEREVSEEGRVRGRRRTPHPTPLPPPVTRTTLPLTEKRSDMMLALLFEWEREGEMRVGKEWESKGRLADRLERERC